MPCLLMIACAAFPFAIAVRMGHRPGLHERLLEFVAAGSLAGALVLSFVSHRLDWMLIPITIGIALLQIGLAWALH